jgi:hypothetical protein
MFDNCLIMTGGSGTLPARTIFARQWQKQALFLKIGKACFYPAERLFGI